MTHQLTLEVPDDVYQPLLQKAQTMGQTVEAVAGACLAQSFGENAPGNLLRKWAGAFASGVSDAGTSHHEHLGQALYDELQGKEDA